MVVLHDSTNKINKKEIIEIVKENMEFNKDGFFSFIGYEYPKKRSYYTLRTLNGQHFTEFLETNIREDTTFVHIHLRYATSGIVSPLNIHGWKTSSGWWFSHNGFYFAYQKSDKSDSLQFFEKEFEPYVEGKKNKLNIYNLYGVTFANYYDEKLLVIPSQKTAKLYKIDDGYLITNEELKTTPDRYIVTPSLIYRRNLEIVKFNDVMTQ
jgi:hypothetical protein